MTVFANQTSQPLIPSPSRWQRGSNSKGVETLELREGISLVLSDIDPFEDCAFHHVEPEDVFAIAFHLKGGSRFDMEGHNFQTMPLEIHAGAAPRASTSTFILPAHGFRTVSIRFAPDAAADLMECHGLKGSGLAMMIEQARNAVSAARLGTLDPASVAMIDAMFEAPIGGAGRSLFLESCALGLLAAQVDALSPNIQPSSSPLIERGLLEARAYLDAHLDAPPSILQLARIAGINDFKLKRMFKAAFGTTIFGYVRQRRMEHAAAALHAGLSVADAAAKVGYECPRCFAGAFRRHFGILPSEVMRAALTDNPARYG